MKALLLDIEGTTTSISFVYEVLFPFARRDLESTMDGRGLLAQRWSDPEVARAVGLMAAPAAPGQSAKAPATPVEAATLALGLMRDDVKDTGLKLLQGMIWESGYISGELRGHVFPDVPVALRRADAAGLDVAIYSSGSVAAQRLLFAFSEAGDLGRYLVGYFDTTTGPKKEPASYLAIARDLGYAPADVAFCTDSLEEARASRTAGLETWMAVRPGNPSLPESHGFRAFSTLVEVLGRNSGSSRED